MKTRQETILAGVGSVPVVVEAHKALLCRDLDKAATYEALRATLHISLADDDLRPLVFGLVCSYLNVDFDKSCRLHSQHDKFGIDTSYITDTTAKNILAAVLND
jgi:hypothetical protein